jgi:hypothetical protein
MALVEDHDVIQTFAANRTDHALDVRVLPRWAWRRDDFGNPYRFDSVAEIRAIRPVCGELLILAQDGRVAQACESVGER